MKREYQLIINYYRQKNHGKVQGMLSFAMHLCIGGHFLLAFLFKTVSWQLNGSIVLEDLGSSVTYGI